MDQNASTYSLLRTLRSALWTLFLRLGVVALAMLNGFALLAAAIFLTLGFGMQELPVDRVLVLLGACLYWTGMYAFPKAAMAGDGILPACKALLWLNPITLPITAAIWAAPRVPTAVRGFHGAMERRCT